MQTSSVIIGAYNLLPEGTEEPAFEETYQVCWRPFLSVLYRFPAIAAVLHYSGTVLHWLESRHPEFLMLLEEMVLRKQIELLGGGFFGPLMPLIPGPDRLGQVELLTTFIRRSFGKRPRGCWLPDYAWEPSLASSLRSCGFDYSFLLERHFRIAGISQDDIGSPVMTEDQGRSLLIFPVFDAAESFPEPLPIEEALNKLVARVGEQRLYTVLFPGESAKSLWAASKLESPDLLFERSFTALLRDGLQFETTTPMRYLKRERDFNRAYFPGCASALLMERSMPTDAGPSLRARKGAGKAADGVKAEAPKSPARPDEGPSCLVGSPRRLLLRHEESLALYAKMHYVRILVGQLRGDKSRKKTAQEELWCGQCGGAYWSGAGGGIARLPVRAAAYAALIEAEKITRQRGSFAAGIISADMDFDGTKEIIYQSADINAYVQLRGACLSELDSFKTRTNYVNVLDSQEAGPRRLCFRDHISEKGSFGTERGGFSDARYALVEAERPASVASLLREGQAELGGKKRSLSITKTYSFRKGGLSVEYEVANKESKPLALRLGTDLNLALGFSAEAVALKGMRGRVELGLATDRKSVESDLNGLRLTNIAKDETIELRSDQPFALLHLPVFSSLEGDAGAEDRTAYQGCAISLGWDLDLPADSARRISLTLELRS
jgi:4-alpha-glucanotransferase